MNFLSRLKLWQKLAVLVVAMAIPSALLGIFYLSGANSQVSLAQDEIEGARYAQALGAVLAEVANHRNRQFAVLTGDTAGRDQVSTSESDLERLISDVESSDSRAGVRFKVSEAWQSIKSDWASLKADGTPQVSVSASGVSITPGAVAQPAVAPANVSSAPVTPAPAGTPAK